MGGQKVGVKELLMAPRSAVLMVGKTDVVKVANSVAKWVQ